MLHSRPILKGQSRFYLNYVECKSSKLNWQQTDNQGFIWTMWNVNALLSTKIFTTVLRFIWTMWNVNYVARLVVKGGKLGFIWTMWNVNMNIYLLLDAQELGFIWTMWNVNSKNAESLATVRLGFIWTMWNVNPLSLTSSNHLGTFYLNYVECKWEGGGNDE